MDIQLHMNGIELKIEKNQLKNICWGKFPHTFRQLLEFFTFDLPPWTVAEYSRPPSDHLGFHPC